MAILKMQTFHVVICGNTTKKILGTLMVFSAEYGTRFSFPQVVLKNPVLLEPVSQNLLPTGE